MKWLRVLGVLVVPLLLSACQRNEDLSPPDIHLGQDTCHACGMIVSDSRFAAAVVVEHDGAEDKFIFDDLGEMLEFKPPAGKVVKYVHDFDSGKWIRFEDANVVKQEKIETPMGTGYVAHLRE